MLLHRVNKHALKQVFLTLEFLDLKEYFIFWIPTNKVFRYLYELILIYFLKLFNLNTDLEFLIIDFRNNYMHSLRRFFKFSKFILIDDGFYTFVAQNNFMSKRVFLPIKSHNNLKGSIVKWLYFGKSYKRLLYSPIKLFTIYADEIESSHIIKNDLCELRKKINFKKIKFNDNEVFFTGTRMVEKGALKLEQELKLILAANIYWNKKEKLCIMSKRSTSKEKLLFFNRMD